MNTILVREFNGTISSGIQCFKTLKHLVPVSDDYENVIYIKGTSSVIYKMEDKKTGKLYAVKIFIDGVDRSEKYSIIEDELKGLDCPYLLPVQYFEDEFFIENDSSVSSFGSNIVTYPVLLMEWIEGVSIGTYLQEAVDNYFMLEMIAYRFWQFVTWITLQPFSHGNIKAENIIVSEDGSFVLIDYDSFYAPDMEKAGKECCKKSSDDFPLLAILISLKAITICPGLILENKCKDYILFEENDFCDILNTKLIKILFPSWSEELNQLFGVLLVLSSGIDLYQLPIQALQLRKPLYEMSYSYNMETDDDVDFDNAWIDDCSESQRVYYSADKSRLLMGSCERLTDYSVKEGTKVICNMAFRRNGCGRNLKRVQLPTSVICIGEEAFRECSNLMSVKMSDNILKIGAFAFSGCNKLESITLPTQLIRIEECTFLRCESIKCISIPNGVTSIGAGAFESCDNLETIELPNTLICIGKNAFEDCYSIKEIRIPKGNMTKFALLMPKLINLFVES